jgi:hypothetical protein
VVAAAPAWDWIHTRLTSQLVGRIDARFVSAGEVRADGHGADDAFDGALTEQQGRPREQRDRFLARSRERLRADLYTGIVGHHLEIRGVRVHHKLPFVHTRPSRREAERERDFALQAATI